MLKIILFMKPVSLRLIVPVLILAVQVMPCASVTLLVTGKTLGLLEHCGCRKDLEGGLEARAGFLKRFRAKNPDCLLLDVGSFFPAIDKKIDKRYTLPGEKRFMEAIAETTLRAMNELKYDAVSIGFNDLAYGKPFLSRVLENNAVPVVTTNVLEAKKHSALFLPSQVLTAGEYTIGVVGAASLRDGRIPCRDFTIDDTSSLIAQEIGALRQKQEIDAVILLADEPPPTVGKWLETYRGPAIDLIVTLDFGIEPKKLGQTYIANAPGRGRAIGKIDLELVKGKGIENVSYERISLDPERYKNRGMRDFLNQAYQRMTNELNLTLDDRAATEDQRHNQETDRTYVGAKDCQGCHEEQNDQWLKTKHAAAFDQLLDNNLHWVPSFVRRHVTGYGTPGGFKEYPASERLAGVQCETCHGPGNVHVHDNGKSSIQRTPSPDLCARCHSPDFDPKFASLSDLYFKQIRH